ncbi:MAG: TldD/PmbA family protein [Alphaproteobacteria bacterium]
MAALDAPIAPEALAPALKRLLSKAKHFGADSADAIATHGRSLSVSVREGALEDVDNSEGKDVGLRVMVGGRQACVSSSDFSDKSLDALAERAVDMAKLAPKDPYCGLAPKELLSTDARDLELFDPVLMTPEQLKIRALAVEKATLSVPGVAQAEGSSASWSTSGVYFMTSHGFESGVRTSRHDLGSMAIATEGDDMERDAEYHGARWFEDLRDAETIGTKAGQRAIARLGSVQMKSMQCPIMFDRRVAGSFVSALVGAINGAAIARGISFLKDELGKPVFAPGIHIIDDPHRLRGYGSRPWDGEGVATQKRNLIEDGKLTTWLLNLGAAKQLGLSTTGHANRGIGSPPGIGASNVHLAPGELSPEALMSGVQQGLFISEMFGPSLNHNTGDYSVGVAGFKIENGEKTSPVSEITVAGNLKDIFKTLVPANDLQFDGSTVSPSILVESLAIAGT